MKIMISGAHLLRVIYYIDPVDLIIAARQGDYDVTVTGDADGLRILIEASPRERAIFRAYNNQAEVYRDFQNPRDLCDRLAICLPELRQDMQDPNAKFTAWIGGCERELRYGELPQIAKYRALKEYMQRHDVQK